MGVKQSVGNRQRGAQGRTTETSQASITDLMEENTRDGEALSQNEIFDLLRNRRRREVLQYLDTHADGSSTLNTLAEYIAAKENDIEPSQLASDQRKRVYIGLYQCHLPKMNDLGVIEYDKNRGTVELQDISQLEPYLYAERESQSHVPLYVAVGVSVVVVAGILGMGPLGAVPTVTWAMVSTATLVAVALFHVLRTDSQLDVS